MTKRASKSNIPYDAVVRLLKGGAVLRYDAPEGPYLESWELYTQSGTNRLGRPANEIVQRLKQEGLIVPRDPKTWTLKS
jgi:hypothetical protein